MALSYIKVWLLSLSHRMIVLQMKSSSNQVALTDISNIISHIKEKSDYEIRGHEIHQVVKPGTTSIRERALSVSNFCSRNEIEYLTYHSPVPRNECLNFADERSTKKAENLLLDTLMEAELVKKESAIENNVLIVYHLPSVVSLEEIDQLDKEKKCRKLKDSETALSKFIGKHHTYIDKVATITVENVFPKYFASAPRYATINMYHPFELVRLSKYGIGITFDFSHYNIYSNYLAYGKGNRVGDLDRELYGTSAPTWNQCIELFGDSLKQVHINDGRGTDSPGEGLMLGEGEIPVLYTLRKINANCKLRSEATHAEEIVQGTVELVNGHCDKANRQRVALEWLLNNGRDIFY